MSKQITIGNYEGKYFLIGPDGYSTTAEQWDTLPEAEEALAEEMKHEEKEEPSERTWVY